MSQTQRWCRSKSLRQQWSRSWTLLKQVNVFTCCFHFVFMHSMLLPGKWHKNNFTNGDVVQLVSMMKERNLAHVSTQCFYDIVKSVHATSMEKKKLFRKDSRVRMMSQTVVNPRKSRRRSSAPDSAPDPTPESTRRKRKCKYLKTYV